MCCTETCSVKYAYFTTIISNAMFSTETYIRSSSCTYTQTLTDTFGYIQSPGYPGVFVTGNTCSWIIVAPADKAVVVLLLDFVTK